MARTPMPPTETRITQAYFIQENIQRELASVVRRQRTGLIPDFLAAWDSAGGIPKGLTPLLHIPLSITSIRDICACMGWMIRHGIGAPLSVTVVGDPRNHTRCRVTIEEGEPRIGIPEYWLWAEYVGHRRAYAAYVDRLATALGLPVLRKGYAAEREFAHIYPAATEREPRINLHSWSELHSAYRTVDWSALLTGWGLRDDECAALSFNVTSTAYLHRFQSRLRSWSLDRWRGWLSLQIVQWLAGCSPHGPLRSAWHAFTMRHMQGVEEDVSPRELRLLAVQRALPNTLGSLWVHQFCAPSLRRSTLQILENVRAGAEEALRTTSWMSVSTREHAIRKLRAMDVQVCWPTKTNWQEAKIPCGLPRDDYVATLMAIASQGTDRSLDVLRGGNCRDPEPDLWGRSVYEVNAFYYPENNRFLLPAAILRPPFYDPRKSLMWNYGAIGATMGHEFCHAFDADGRHYNEQGDYRDWWTDADDREYRKRAAAVVKLYESTPYRGMAVDGNLTLLENIADIGGLEFALAGAKKAVGGRDLTKAELREFFRAFAVSWRSKDRLKRAAELLEKDPHAPPMLRVNHTVRQFNEWYEAFGLECPSSEKRVRFFGHN
jgi:putative endopeptidase